MGCEIAFVSQEPSQLLETSSADEIDLILIDYQIFATLGGNLLEIKRRIPRARIVITASNSFELVLAASIKLGADGFYRKCDPISELGRIIIAVSNGIRDIVKTKIATSKLPKLSRNEMDVLLACLEGISISDLARQKGKSIKTVSRQKRLAYQKLGIDTDFELFRGDVILKTSGIL